MDAKIDSSSSSSSDDPSDPETSDTSNQTEKQSSDGHQTPPCAEIPFKIELDSTISQDSVALPNPLETSGQSVSPAECGGEQEPFAKTEEKNPPESATADESLEEAVSGSNSPTNSNASGLEKSVPNQPETSGQSASLAACGADQEHSAKTDEKNPAESATVDESLEEAVSGSNSPTNSNASGQEESVPNQQGTPGKSTASSKCKDEVEQPAKLMDQNLSEASGIESLEGAVGGAYLVFTDPSACKKELNAAITEDRYQDCYERLFASFARQKAKQTKDANTREKCGIYGEAKLEHYENREEICTRGWLKYSLPREAEFLDSTAQNPAATPPDLQEDLIYSLSLGILSKEERSKWEKAVLLGNKLKEIAEIASRADRQDELQTYRVNFIELLSNIVWELEEQLGHSDLRRLGSFNTSLCEEDTSTGIPLLRTDSSNTDPDMPDLESDAAFEKIDFSCNETTQPMDLFLNVALSSSNPSRNPES